MKMLKKLKNRKAFSLIELLIVIALLSVVTLPAYMTILNGYELFHDESTYQTVVSDVQLFYNQLNTNIRLSGFDETSIIDSTVELDKYPDLKELVPKNPILVLKIATTFYYLKDTTIYKYSNNEIKLAENISALQIQETSDSNLLTLKTTINVEGRSDTISTSIYDRYETGVE